VTKILKILLVNLVVIFVLLEGGMRLYYGISDEAPPHTDHSVVREWRWVKKRLEDGKIRFDKRFVHDRYAGWKNAPNINTEDMFGSSIRTNSDSMRNDREFPLEPEPGRQRLLIVGDSYSFGHGVANEDTFAFMLGRELMPDWDVMNLAVSATGTDQQLIMYEKYGEMFKPDVVILGFYVLDFNRNTFSFRDYAKPMFIPQQDGSLVLTHSPVISPRELINEYQTGKRQIGGWHYSYAYAAFRKVFTTHTKRDRSEGSLPRRTLTGIMERFSKRVTGNGATPVFVIFPIRDIIEKEVSKYEVIEEFAAHEAQRLGMPVLRLEPIFRTHIEKQPEVSLWRPKEIGGHLSAAGNRLAAHSIHNFLETNGLIKPATASAISRSVK
jgi:hypothetical protein